MGTAEGAAATETQEAEQRTPLTLTIGGKELRTALDRTGKAIRGLNTGRRGETASNRVRVGIHRDAEGRGTGYIQMEAADETAKVRTPIGIEEAGKAGRSEGDGWAEIGGAILRETAAAARGRIRITAPPPETEPLPGTLGLSTGEPAFGFLTAEVVGRYGPEPERRTEPGEAQGRNRNRIRLGMHTLEQELQRAAGGFRSLWITTYPGRDGVEADAVFRAYEAAHGNPRYYRSRTAGEGPTGRIAPRQPREGGGAPPGSGVRTADKQQRAVRKNGHGRDRDRSFRQHRPGEAVRRRYGGRLGHPVRGEAGSTRGSAVRGQRHADRHDVPTRSGWSTRRGWSRGRRNRRGKPDRRWKSTY